MSHALSFVPLRHGREVACWLDRPIDRVLLGCVCGWRGPALALSAEEVAGFYGDDLPGGEAAFTRVHDWFEALHWEALVPGLRDLRVHSRSERCGSVPSAAL